ncbi:MAG: hypothetical protein RJA76_1550 [Bacteroidota bacterium]|jgi:hypothetical protein
MTPSNKSNKFIFGLGIFFILLLGLDLALYNTLSTKSVIYLILGVYNIWQQGFVKDTKSWKIKPIYFVLLTILIVIGLIVYKFNNKPKKQFQAHPTERVVDQLAKINQEFPISIGNNDSIISIKPLNNFTLETRYKLNTNVLDLDSIAKRTFIEGSKEILINKLKSKKESDLRLFRSERINFIHRYLDSNMRFVAEIIISSDQY